MFCSKCGKELPDDSKVCPDCGNKLGGVISVDTGELSKKISAVSEKGKKVAAGIASQAKEKSEELIKKSKESEKTKEFMDMAASAGQKISYKFLAVSIAQALELILWFCTFLVAEEEYGISERVSLFELGNPVERFLSIILMIAAIGCSVLKTIKQDVRIKPVPVICIVANALALLVALTARMLSIPAISNAMASQRAGGSQYAEVYETHITFAGFLLTVIPIALIVIWSLHIKKEKRSVQDEK